MEQNKVEELMKPRYKVIADYPNNVFEIGEVIISFSDGCENLYNHYPAIFKPLQWWEERATDEMPDYVKRRIESPIIPVLEWEGFNVNDVPLFEGRLSKEHGIFRGKASDFLPATENEYNEYIKTKSNATTEQG